MDNPKNDTTYLNAIIDDLNYIIGHMNGVSLEEFSNFDLLQDSMMFRLIQISENSKNLSDAYKAQKEEVNWNAMSGLRNRIVHDYGNVMLDIVYDTLTMDIPLLRHQLSDEK